ncbi:hypothetical protein BCR32DRAFT_294752 [Anaeromyces robustus]|uniref:MARVEL domain-containing protein n=1 Tax=Anaeromyces robustus TaxID=1754192 RepID=A0A1Y1WZF8_9FUNG|nr:hypothetical protein BCR32DRAFT_294752 [Anaeromyces robustus]|eukprot:ORX78930.1 hypothetical protein BCR32DRAFT_294752 [Anaeromyces robustus]
MFSLKVSDIFKDNAKCVPFFFLSHDISQLFSTIIIIGITVATYFFNIMLHDEMSNFVLDASRIFGICILISYTIFLFGMAWKKKLFLLSQLTITLAIYIFFCFACFSCIFVTLLFGEAYRKSYNIYHIYTNYYFDDHPDSNLEYEEVKSKIKTKFIVETIFYILSLLIMIYYYKVTSAYIEIKKASYGEDYDTSFISSSKYSSSTNI